MKIINTFARATATTVLGAALMSGVAMADMSADLEAQAAEIEQAIALNPEYNADGGKISVDAADGRIVLTGFVDGLQQMNDINQMLQDMDGLDMDIVDNNLIQQ